MTSFSLLTKSYQGRYLKLDCIQTKDVVNNRSRIDWKLSSVGGQVRGYSTGPTTVIINGETVYNKARVSYQSGAFPAVKGSTSGFIYVTHDDEGKATIELSIKTAIYVAALSTVKGTWTLDDLPQSASILTAPDFNDTQKELTITYSNPWGEDLEYLGACISLTGEIDDIPYREIDKLGSSYTFTLTDGDITMLQKKTQGGDSRRVKFYLKSVRDGEFKFDWLERTFKILDAQPPTIEPTIKDTNAKTKALTGNDTVFIKHHSNLYYEVNAEPHKNAEIVSYRVTCDNTLSSDAGLFDKVSSNQITFQVKDSRNKLTQETIPLTVIPYFPPSCNLKLGKVILNDSESQSVSLPITISGEYFNESFGAVNNTLSIYIRHTDNEGVMGEWVNVTSKSSLSIENNSYSLNFNINELIYNNTYTFQSKVVDKLGEFETIEYPTKLYPVFDWGKDDFKFNVPVTINARDFLTVPAPNVEGDSPTEFVKFLGYEEEPENEGTALQLGFKDGFYSGFDFNIYGGGFLKLSAPLGIRLESDSEQFFLNDNVLADYVIETGTESMGSNGTWHWRKWNSGLAEAWGKRNFGNVGFSTTYGGLYRSETFTQSIPSIFNAEPTYIDIQPMEGSGGTWVLRGLDTNISESNVGGFALCRPNTTALSQVHLGFNIRGTWK